MVGQHRQSALDHQFFLGYLRSRHQKFSSCEEVFTDSLYLQVFSHIIALSALILCDDTLGLFLHLIFRVLQCNTCTLHCIPKVSSMAIRYTLDFETCGFSPIGCVFSPATKARQCSLLQAIPCSPVQPILFLFQTGLVLHWPQ